MSLRMLLHARRHPHEYWTACQTLPGVHYYYDCLGTGLIPVCSTLQPHVLFRYLNEVVFKTDFGTVLRVWELKRWYLVVEASLLPEVMDILSPLPSSLRLCIRCAGAATI